MDLVQGTYITLRLGEHAHEKMHAALHGEKEAGALQVVDCWGEDVPEGTVTSFPMAVKCQEDETVVFSWIVWPSKEVRNAAWKRMEQDERFHPDNNPMPFDGMRMMFGLRFCRCWLIQAMSKRLKVALNLQIIGRRGQII